MLYPILTSETSSVVTSNYYITYEQKPGREYIWVPYLDNLERLELSKPHWLVIFKGGELRVNLANCAHVAFYGKSDGSLPLAFLYDCEKYAVSLCIYTRNRVQRLVLTHKPSKTVEDVITRQILVRNDQRKRAYISRCLIRNKLKSQQWLKNYRPGNLKAEQTIDELRVIEAVEARRYWAQFYKSLNKEDLIRKQDHPINSALNACYFFLSSSIVRWLHHHGFSPFHGYLHQPVSYEALAWDLIEPYRWIADRAVRDAWLDSDGDETRLVGTSISNLKGRLNKQVVWVPATRQYTRTKNLLQGVVLALKAYLMGDRHFVVPIGGLNIGGRPPKVSYTLPGQIFQEQVDKLPYKEEEDVDSNQ